MANITENNLLAAFDGTDLTVYTTASVSPAANQLLLLTVASQRNSANPTDAVTITGNGLTWVKIGTDVCPTGTNGGRITLFRAMGGAPSSGTITITHGEEMRYCSWQLSEFDNVRTTGANGADAVVQTVTAGADTQTITATLAAFEHANNATFGGVCNINGSLITEGTGFTEIADNPTILGLQTQWRVDNDTSVDFTSAGGSDSKAAVAVEIRNAVGAIFGTLLTADKTTTDATSFATASVTPTANHLLLLGIVHHRSGGSPVVPTVTGNGLTWVNVDSEQYNPAETGAVMVSLFRSMGGSPSAGAVTMDFSGDTQAAIGWILYEFDNVNTGGANGADAVVQSANNSVDTGTTSTVTLAAFGHSENGAYGVSATGGPTFSAVGTGFEGTLQTATNIGGHGAEWRRDNDTVVDFTLSSGSQWGIVGVEIKSVLAVDTTSAAGTAGHLGFNF